MSEAIAQLPARFKDLESLAHFWVRTTENGRNAVRFSATAEEFSAFYAKMMPRLEALLDFLAKCEPRTQDNSPERTALLLVCAFAEAAPHHELYGGSSQVPFSFDARRFIAHHGDETT